MGNNGHWVGTRRLHFAIVIISLPSAVVPRFVLPVGRAPHTKASAMDGKMHIRYDIFILASNNAAPVEPIDLAVEVGWDVIKLV